MLLVSLEGTNVRLDGRLPGYSVPWEKICQAAKLVRFDEFEGIVYVWKGGTRIEMYDTCGRLVDYRQYPKPPQIAKVLTEVKAR